MECQPKISVIIPVYNAEKYLKDCLDNIVAQTFKEIEIVCVDDGSSDGSLTILQEYAKKEPRLTVLAQENQGAGVARNLAMASAKGQYIVFMDSDDCYPDKTVLEKMYRAASQNNALICGGSVQFLRRGKLVPGELRGVSYCFEREGWLTFRELQQDFYYQRFMFSRSLLNEHGIAFPYYRRYQDPPFFVRAMLAAERIYVIPDYVYTYREGSANGILNFEKAKDKLTGITEELNLLKEARLETLYIRVVRQRIRQTFDDIASVDGLCQEPEIQAGLKTLRKAIDTKWLQALGTPVDIEFLDSYLRNTKKVIPPYVRMATAFDDSENLPKVSVVIPIYNVEEYIHECMHSVINQTLRDIEIICVDDSSPDDCLEIIEAYADADPRITVVHQENKGLSGARNGGHEVARGKYIYFLDSDDYLELNALELLYKRCEQDQLDALFFDFYRFYDDGSSGAPQVTRKEYPEVTDGVSLARAFREDKTYISCSWAILFLKEFLDRNQIRFYQGIIHEDELHTPLVLMHARRVSHMGEKLYQHRIRPDSIMTVSVSKKNVIGYFIGMREMLKFGLSDVWDAEKTQEIWSSFDKLKKLSLWKYEKLPIEEKAAIVFDDPFSQTLFDIFVAKQEASGAIDASILKLALDTQNARAEKISSVKEQTDNTDETAQQVIELTLRSSELLKLLQQQTTVNALLKKEIQDIHKSLSYRIGRMITWLPRKIRGCMRCYQDHGLRYTAGCVLKSLHLKK